MVWIRFYKLWMSIVGVGSLQMAKNCIPLPNADLSPSPCQQILFRSKIPAFAGRQGCDLMVYLV
ncbi:hypothetical protein DHC50_09100 [Arenibacter sp. A80]|nr:hypothetical protein [Arenibacter sp. A80]